MESEMNSKLKALKNKLKRRFDTNRPGAVQRIDPNGPDTPVMAEDILELLTILEEIFAELEKERI
jgi:hypothetical protein